MAQSAASYRFACDSNLEMRDSREDSSSRAPREVSDRLSMLTGVNKFTAGPVPTFANASSVTSKVMVVNAGTILLGRFLGCIASSPF